MKNNNGKIKASKLARVKIPNTPKKSYNKK